jgi:hypothetical protein
MITPIWTWDFLHEICVMRDCHEARECWLSEDRVMLRWPVHYFKLQFFSPEVVSVAEANIEFDSAQWVISTSWDNSMEGTVCWLQELKGNIHCPQSLCLD